MKEKPEMIYFDQMTDDEFLTLIRENSTLSTYFKDEVLLRWKAFMTIDCPHGVDKAKFIGYIPDGRQEYELLGFLGGTRDE